MLSIQRIAGIGPLLTAWLQQPRTLPIDHPELLNPVPGWEAWEAYIGEHSNKILTSNIQNAITTREISEVALGRMLSIRYKLRCSKDDVTPQSAPTTIVAAENASKQ